MLVFLSIICLCKLCMYWMFLQKLVEQFTYVGRSISSTKSNVNMRVRNVWTVIDRLMTLISLINKTEILLSCNTISTIVWFDHMDFKRTHGEKACWELCKDAASCFGQILEAETLKKNSSCKATSFPSPKPFKTCKTYWALMKDKLLHMNSQVLAKPKETYVHQFYADTGYHLKDIPSV